MGIGDAAIILRTHCITLQVVYSRRRMFLDIVLRYGKGMRLLDLA